MRRPFDSYTRHRDQPVYYLLINPTAAGFSRKKIDFLTNELNKAGKPFHAIDITSFEKALVQLRGIVQRRPEGIIACGGDSTVNLAAQTIIRRTTGLGIFPLGRFNNIYRSLFGEPDLDSSVQHILSDQSKRIDHGLASGRFFLGSVGLGLIPEIFDQMKKGKNPRFGLGWSRLAAQAAATVSPKQISIKIDAFRFDLMPRLLNINLLPYSVGLPIAPAAIDDDGKGEVIFDIGQNKAILSSFIRMIYKKKYIYSDEIRLFRGSKITISPIPRSKLYIDGEIVDHALDMLEIEFFEKKIRVLYRQGR